MNDLQPNEYVLGCYQQPYFNPNKVRVEVKLLITLAHWSDYVECEWWLDELYHPSMKFITIDMKLASVVMVGKIFGRVKRECMIYPSYHMSMKMSSTR